MQVPDYMLWDAFFFRVNWLNDLANRLDAKGQNGNWARSQIADQTHMASQQQQALNAIAADFRTTNNALIAQIAALAGPGASAANAQQVLNLQNQRKQNVLDHIAQLQAALGSTGFGQFEAYVHGTAHTKAYSTTTAAQPQQPAKEPL
jgi:hypothetical protein